MIEHYLTQISHYLQAHVYMGIFFAFLISFTESLPLIGTIIPGSVTMSIIGILVGRGMISLNATLSWAAAGALFGDTVGFFIGKYYNEHLRLIWPFKRYPQWLRVGETLFEKHGGKSILIGRFVGPVRSSVPLIAGLLKMGWPRFLFSAIPSAIFWAIAYLLPGVLIGTMSLRLPHHVTTAFILTGLAIIVLVWLLFWAIQHFFSFLVSMINNIVNYLWRWLYCHHSSRFLLQFITNRKIPTDHYQLTTVLLAFLSLCCFFLLTIVVAISGPSTGFNEPLFYFLQSLRCPNFDKFFTIITVLGDAQVIISIVLILISALIVKRLFRPAVHLTAVTLITGCFIFFTKQLIYSSRPTGFLILDYSSSFPSGHIGLSLPIFGFIAFLTAQQISEKWRWIPYILTTILIILISYSRLYLGAHWLEDILGGFFFGFAILLSIIVSYRRYTPPKAFGNLKWLIFLIFAITIPWAGFSKLKYHTLIHRYIPIWPIRETTIEDWWQNPLRYVPIFRINRFGHPTQPLNIQWIDGLSTIEKTLEQKGWQTIRSKTDVQTTLGRFTSYKPECHLPLFPWLYRDKPPVLFMIKHLPHDTTIIELRLWKPGLRFENSHLPLWIGSINYHLASKHLMTLLYRSHDITWLDSKGINKFISILSGYQWRRLKIVISSQESKKKHYFSEWDGTLLLIRSQKEKI